MKQISAVVLGLCLCGYAALRADERAPAPAPPKAVELTLNAIESDLKWGYSEDKDVRIIIPKAMLTEGKKSSFHFTRTAVSGLALALALSFGGLWLSRRKTIGRPLMVSIGALTMLGVLGGAAYADMRTSITDFPWGTPFGKVKVEFKNVKEVRLAIPFDQLGKLAETHAKHVQWQKERAERAARGEKEPTTRPGPQPIKKEAEKSK